MARWNMDIPPCDAAEYARLLRVQDAAVALVDGLERDKGSDGGDYYGGNVGAEMAALLYALTEDLIKEAVKP